MNRPFSLQRLANSDPELAGRSAFGVISTIQPGSPPEETIAGVAVALQLLAQKHGVRLGQVLEISNNLIDRALDAVPTLGASFDFIKHET